MEKEFILSEIQRTAVDGRPLGRQRFMAVTGISGYYFSGKYWKSYSCAVAEAGFKPNQLTKAIDRAQIVAKYTQLASELGKLPTTSELRLKRSGDPSFPSANTVYSQFTKRQLAAEVAEYCATSDAYSDVLQMCETYLITSLEILEEQIRQPSKDGYVYLVKVRRGYKIGRTDDWEQRQRQIQLHNPDLIVLIHLIKTDDAAGVEVYWHRRFREKRVQTKSKAGKRLNWFNLSLQDVHAFKRWKQI
ncbi:GIY-YIG nuclease family protein [bacterium]|nr:GIY-YIG nuclease family protein [bacterium]